MMSITQKDALASTSVAIYILSPPVATAAVFIAVCACIKLERKMYAPWVVLLITLFSLNLISCRKIRGVSVITASTRYNHELVCKNYFRSCLFCLSLCNKTLLDFLATANRASRFHSAQRGNCVEKLPNTIQMGSMELSGRRFSSKKIGHIIGSRIGVRPDHNNCGINLYGNEELFTRRN